MLPTNAVPIYGSDEEVANDPYAQSVLHLTTDDGGVNWQYSIKGINLS